MSGVYRKDFSGGWNPSADSVNGPKNALCRMDNVVLDEIGALALRRGSKKVSTANLDNSPVTNLFTTTINGTKWRLAASGNYVYTKKTVDYDTVVEYDSAGLSFEGTGDIQLGSYLGQVFMGRSTSRYRYKGTTNAGGDPEIFLWGIEKPAGKPSAAKLAGFVTVIDDCESATTSHWTANEDDGVTGVTRVTNYAKGTYSYQVTPDATTGRSTVTLVDYPTFETAAYEEDWSVFPIVQNNTFYIRKTTDSGSNYTSYDSGVITLSSLDTLANGDWLIVGYTSRFEKIYFDMDAVNANASVMTVQYWNGADWVSVLNLSDGTASGGATFAQDGNVTFDAPHDWQPYFIDGNYGYFVRISVSAALDSSVTTVTNTAIIYLPSGGDDRIQFYFWAEEPTAVQSIQLMVELNSTTAAAQFKTDYYSYTWDYAKADTNPTVCLTVQEYFEQIIENHGGWDAIEALDPDEDPDRLIEKYWAQAERKRQRCEERAASTPSTSVESSVGAGWNLMSVPKSAFLLTSENDKDWSTPKGIRLSVQQDPAAAGNINFDHIHLIGGVQRPLDGRYIYKIVYARSETYYTALSEPSVSSDSILLENDGATITIPTDSNLTAGDIDEIWVYRFGGFMDSFYRIATVIPPSTWPAATFTVSDTTDDLSALILNFRIQLGNGRPPQDIIDIEGPYYDRLFTLTKSYIYPSRQRNPESYDTFQAIRIAGADEVALWIKKAFNGLYIGTTKDIYRLDGTGSEFPDGTIDWRITPLNIGTPPISPAVAEEGNTLIYLSSDGWRLFNGTTSGHFRDAVDLLWKGHARHGVNPINIGEFNSIDSDSVRYTVDGGSNYTDFTSESSDGDAATHVSIGGMRAGDWLAIGSYEYRFSSITIDMDSSVNSSLSTLSVEYWNGSAWTAVSNLSDGTASGGATFAQDGTITFDEPTDWEEQILDLITGYYVRLTVSNNLSTTVNIDAIQISIDGAQGIAYSADADHIEADTSAESYVSARFKAAISKGIMYALTPEGTSTVNSPALHVYNFNVQRWYRQVYPYYITHLYREPDGTVLSGDSIGWVRIMDVGQRDDNADIAVTLWTMKDDLDLPQFRKDLWQLRLFCDVSDTLTIQMHRDGFDTSSGSITFNQSAIKSIQTMPTLTQVQMRMTGSFSQLKLREWEFDFRQRAQLMVDYEEKPIRFDTRARLGGFLMTIDTLSQDATVTPYLDDTAQSTFTVNHDDATTERLVFNNVIARNLWHRTVCSTGFELYKFEPIVLEKYPEQWSGRGPGSNFGTDDVKHFSRVRIKACTLGETRTFQFYLDGTLNSTQFTLTSDADEPVTDTFTFTSEVSGTDIAMYVDGTVEVWEWEPIVDYTTAGPTRFWDTGYIDLEPNSPDLFWMREIKVKADTSADLNLTLYFDGQQFNTVTLAVDVINAVTVFTVPIPRDYKGRQPRLTVYATGTVEFEAYWVEWYYRPTKSERGDRMRRIYAK